MRLKLPKIQKNSFWPFPRGSSFLWSLGLLIGLGIIHAIMRITLGWPTDQAETEVILGIGLFSLLPILLSAMDAAWDSQRSQRGDSLHIDWDPMEGFSEKANLLPADLGSPDQTIEREATDAILPALNSLASAPVSIVDLEDGQTWRETRLLTLLTASARAPMDHKIVFVGAEAGARRRPVGWAYGRELLAAALKVDGEYSLAFHQSAAAARQWDLVEPSPDGSDNHEATIRGDVARKYDFSGWRGSGRNVEVADRFLRERILSGELGARIEKISAGRRVSAARVDEVFRAFLRKTMIDRDWEPSEQIQALDNAIDDYLIVTRNGEFVALVARKNFKRLGADLDTQTSR